MKTSFRQLGFTLTELVVAIAVLAIGIGLTVPSFNDMVEKKRLKRAAEAVIADFNFFRQEGLKRRAVSFSFNVDDGTSWCYGIETGTCDCTTADDCSVRQVMGSDFADVSSVTSTASNYAYSWVRGTVTAGSITFDSPAGFDLRVVISALGRTSICSPSDNMSEYPSC